MYHILWTICLISGCVAPLIANTVKVEAYLSPSQEAILSAEISGRVDAVLHSMGASVQKGQALLQFESAIYEANLEKARAQERQHQLTYEAQASLYRDGSITEAELARYKSLAVESHADATVAQKYLEACTLRAPFDGAVETVFVRPYEMAQSGQKLVKLIGVEKLIVEGFLPGRLKPHLKKGLAIRFEHEQDGRFALGTLTHISPAIDPSSSLVKVQAEIDNTQPQFAPGMTGLLVVESPA